MELKVDELPEILPRWVGDWIFNYANPIKVYAVGYTLLGKDVILHMRIPELENTECRMSLWGKNYQTVKKQGLKTFYMLSQYEQDGKKIRELK